MSTCPALASNTSPLLDGEEYETDNTGCCATIKKVCKKENCPAEIQCSKNLVKVLDLSTKDSCCPKYKCGRIRIIISSYGMNPCYRYPKRQVSVYHAEQGCWRGDCQEGKIAACEKQFYFTVLTILD